MPPNHRPSPFPTTHWTLVEQVQAGDENEVARALEDLCASYWFPIYSFLRASGKSCADAEDLTQIFFAQLVGTDLLKSIRRDRGRLRSYLLGSLKRVMSDESRHRQALKRGGGKADVSFDEVKAEELYRSEALGSDDPEKLYLHAWATELLQRAVSQLRATFETEGRLELFATLRPWLEAEEELPPYAELARSLDSSPGAVRVLVHRLRKNLRKALEREIANTVTSPAEIEEELIWLRKVLTD